MSFTNSKRVNCGKAMTDTDISVLLSNSDWIATKYPILAGTFYIASQSIPSPTQTAISFASGTAAFWSAGSPTRVTVPAGYNLIQFDFYTYWMTTMGSWNVTMKKNGASFAGKAELNCNRFQAFVLTSMILDCTAGDYFEFYVQQASGSANAAEVNVSCRAWQADTSSTNTGKFISSVRALKGQAPNAGIFNKIAHNLEVLNTRKNPVHVNMSLTSNKTITLTNSVLVGTQILDFDQVVSDNNSLYSSGVITIPPGARFAREVISAAFSGGNSGAAEFVMNTQIGSSIGLSRAISFGTGGTKVAAGTLQMDTGWVPVTGGSTIFPQLSFDGINGNTWSILQNDATWYCLEIV